MAPDMKVLVADDQPDVLVALDLLLKGEGWEIETAASPQAALDAATRRRFDAVLMDLNYTRDTTSGAEGLDLLRRLRSLDGHVPVVVMTAWGTIELAVEAMRRGAHDFVLKPWSNAALLERLRAQMERTATERTAERDLAIAHRVQEELLPKAPPPLRTLDCAGRCLQAAAVGGDAYDFPDLGKDRVGLVLADASGKGIGAALLMANLQASLRGRATADERDLASFLEAVNARFFASTAPEHYATLFFGEYDDDTRRLRYANCGHPPPILLRADGSVERLLATAPVIGLIEDWTGATAEVAIDSGDSVLLFSDGVTEAENHAGDSFGEARLLEVLRAAQGRPVPATLDALLAAVNAFRGRAPEDDVTVVLARGR